jgi:ABC-type nitrate/sulfonate/bicarbonate transport system permease component
MRAERIDRAERIARASAVVPKPGALTKRARRFASVCLFFALWELVSRWLLPAVRPDAATLLPPPTAVVRAFVELVQSGVIQIDIAASLTRIVIGFAIASVAGVLLGALMGFWPVAARLFDPFLEFLRPIPPMAWIPLGLLWFGISDVQNVFIIFMGAVYPIVLNTYAGVRGVDRNLVWAAQTLGGGRWQILREIVIPGALPVILAGLRIGLGVGWMGLVAAELVGASSGLAFLIEDSRNLLFTERVLLGMALIGILGFGMDQLMRLAQRRLVKGLA